MAKDLAQALGIDDEQIAVLAEPELILGNRAVADEPAMVSGAGHNCWRWEGSRGRKGFDLLLNALVVVRENH